MALIVVCILKELFVCFFRNVELEVAILVYYVEKLSRWINTKVILGCFWSHIVYRGSLNLLYNIGVNAPKVLV